MEYWKNRTGISLTAVIVLGLAWFWRFGYDYGSTDLDELLPYVMALVDPSLFTADAFIQSQLNTFNVRFYFAHGLAIFARFLPLWIVVLAGHLVVWIIISNQLYLLAFRWINHRFFSSIAVFLILVVSHKWTLGTNDLFYTAFTPEPVAWALSLTALNRFLDKRWIPAGLLSGLATWFHLLAGLLPALLLGMILLWTFLRGDTWRHSFAFGFSFFIASLPVSFPLAQVVFRQAVDLPAPSTFFIQVQYRLAHHHLLSAFNPVMAERFLFLLCIGIASGIWLHRKRNLHEREFLVAALVVTCLFCLLSVAGTTVFSSLFIARFQFFKLTVLVKTFAVILTVAAACRFFAQHPIPWHRFRFLTPKLVPWTVFLLVGLTVGLVVTQENTFRYRLRSLSHRSESLGKVEKWARYNTQKNAVFTIPPGITTFRTVSQRSVAVNWLAFPFQEPEIHDWYRRLMLVSPSTLTTRTENPIHTLDSLYHNKTDAQWKKMVDELDVDYILIDSTATAVIPAYPRIFSSSSWIILQTSEKTTVDQSDRE